MNFQHSRTRWPMQYVLRKLPSGGDWVESVHETQPLNRDNRPSAIGHRIADSCIENGLALSASLSPYSTDDEREAARNAFAWAKAWRRGAYLAAVEENHRDAG